MDKAKGFLDEIRTMHAHELKDDRTKEDNKDDKIKLKEIVEAWQEKMKNKKGKKSGSAEGQEKKDKNRTGKGQEKDKKSGPFVR
jgi:hypothetical protein